MNKEQKAAVVEEVARDLREADAIIAVDYRGISVKQSADLRAQLAETGARFRVVKNRLTQRAADEAGVSDNLAEFLEGPTALTFVPAEGGDAALAAKALAAFRREHGLPEFKGGAMEGRPLTAADIDALSRLPARDVLYGQLVGITASPISGLVRTLNALVSGLAIQLGKIQEEGLVGGNAPADGGAAASDGDAQAAGGGDDAATDAGDGDAAGDDEDSGGDDAADDDAADDVAGAATGEEESGDATAAPAASGGDSDDEVAEAATEAEAEDDPSVSSPADEAPGDPVAEAATADEDEQDDQETSE